MDPNELFDVVDERNCVVGRASRARCHAERLPHRSVMFFVRNPSGRVLVTRRSRTKEFFPGCWSIAFGGHVAAGEDYLTAVRREVVEEAGVEAEPEPVGRFVKSIPEEIEHVAVFGFTVDCEPSLCAEEIEFGEFCDPAELEARIGSESFLPETGELMALLKKWLDS